MTTRAAVYVRISSDPEGLREGVERQIADSLALCQARGYEPTVFEENDTGASAASRKARPKYAQMLERVRAGDFQVIVAYSNSRLTRRPMELEDLIVLHERTGVLITTVVSGQDDLSTADGRMVARIKASVDAAEAERVSERTRRAYAAKRERGDYVGGARPFGWGEPVWEERADGKRVLSATNVDKINKTEAAMIRKAAQHIINGERSVWALVREFNASGVPSVRGKSWHQTSVIRVLTQEPNLWVRGKQGPILDEQTQATVTAILRDPKRMNRPHGTELKHFLAGVPECSVCGKKLISGGPSGGPLYKCPDQHVGIRRHRLERIVSLAVASSYAAGDRSMVGRTESNRTIAAVHNDLAELAAEREEIMQSIQDKLVTLKGMKPRLTELRDQEEALRAELENIRQSDAHEALTEAAVRHAETRLTSALDNLLGDSPQGHTAPFDRAVAILHEFDALAAKSKRELVAANFRIVVAPGRAKSRVQIWRNGVELTAENEDMPN